MDSVLTVAEVAKLMGLSENTVRRMFLRQPGTIVLNGPRQGAKGRRYRTIRIPRAVYERVLARHTVR